MRLKNKRYLYVFTCIYMCLIMYPNVIKYISQGYVNFIYSFTYFMCSFTCAHLRDQSVCDHSCTCLHRMCLINYPPVCAQLPHLNTVVFKLMWTVIVIDPNSIVYHNLAQKSIKILEINLINMEDGIIYKLEYNQNRYKVNYTL